MLNHKKALIDTYEKELALVSKLNISKIKFK